MKRIFRAFAGPVLAGALVGTSLPAGATVVLTSVSLTPFMEPGLTENFEDPAYAPFITSVQFTGSARIVHDSVSGQYATPFGHSADDQYVSVFGGTSATFTFNHGVNFFGLQWGSVDAYNSLDFYNNGTLVGHFTGTDLAASGIVTSSGYQGYGGTAYIGLLMTDGYFDKMVMTSSSNSFEFDNISVATVPAPGALPLLATGLIGLGLLGRRARRRAA